jgi:hypothetical protein
MIDVERMRALARGEYPEGVRKSAFLPVAPVAATSATGAATGVSRWNYSATGATGQFASYREKNQKEPVAEPVAACGRRRPEFEFEADQAEREAKAIELGGVPTLYARTFAMIQVRPARDVPPARWNTFVDDAGRFLDSWGQRAVELDWSVADLFNRQGPQTGLLWSLQGQTVTDLSARTAKLSDGLIFRKRS